MFDIKIGPYKIVKRTEYSKPRLFYNNEDITTISPALLEQIMEDYKRQTKRPEDYFVIKGGKLTDLRKSVETEKIKFLFVPDNVKTIGNGALQCNDFEYINLPDTLKVIEDTAFCSCIELRCLDIPNSVTQIGAFAFSECEALEHVKLPENLNFIENNTFYSCIHLKDIIIPDKVKVIGDYAFEECERLKNIVLPPKIERIGGCAFINCVSLESIELSTHLKEIGVGAFMECENLKKIIIPNEVEKIGERAFANCTMLEQVKLPNNLKALEDGTFFGCENLNFITIPDSIEEMGGRIFSSAKCIDNIKIPRNLKSINSLSFEDSGITTLTFLHNLEDLSLKNSVYVDYDLIYSSKIDKLVIDSSVSTISKNAFYMSGAQIKVINYLGTKEQFEKFKKNNEELFTKHLTNIQNVNFVNPSVDKEAKNIEIR